MNRKIGAALLAAGLVLAGGVAANDYNCATITETARAAQREAETREIREITRTCENGGLYCPPKPTDKSSCAQRYNRYIQGINTFLALPGFAGYSQTFKRALDEYLNYANNEVCDLVNGTFEEYRGIIEDKSGGALEFPPPF